MKQLTSPLDDTNAEPSDDLRELRELSDAELKRISGGATSAGPTPEEGVAMGGSSTGTGKG